MKEQQKQHIFKGSQGIAIAVIVGLIVFAVNLICSIYYWDIIKNKLDIILSHSSDPIGYYQYLPAIFIDDNLRYMAYAVRLENNNMLSVFHIGVAILQLPFFLIGHAYTLITGGDATGYSSGYAVALIFGVSTYLGAAMTLLILTLRQYFTLFISVLTALLIYSGTNLFYYSFRENGMSHVYSFFLIVLLIFLTHVFEGKKNWKIAFLLAVTASLIILIKPNNGVVLLYFLFFNVKRLSEFYSRIKYVFLPIKIWIPAVLVASLLIGLQVGYWHYVSGNFIVFSYGAIGEGFNWGSPELYNVLFSPQNGWLIYSPIMILPMGVLLVLASKNKLNGRITLVIWLLAWYVFSSWWAWWFGAAYGHRAFIEYLPLLAIPMAYGLSFLQKKSWILFYTTLIIMVFFSWVNLGMSYDYEVPWDGPDWGWDEYYIVLEKAVEFDE